MEAEYLTIMKQAEVLYYVRAGWDKLSSEVTAKYNYEFNEWARQYTHDGVIQSDTTIRNKIGVYRDWVASGSINPPKLSDGTEIDPMKVKFSKLLFMRRKAKDGSLTEEAWEALADNSVSVSQLKAIANGHPDVYPQADESPTIAFYINDDVLIARTAETSVVVAHLMRDNAKYDAWERAVEAMSEMLGAIDFSIPESNVTMGEQPVLSLTDNGIMISKEGVGISLTISEVETLIDIVTGRAT
jgi:hypothetical protein